MPETSLCLSCVHGTCVADGAHQTSTQSPLTFKHLFHRGTRVCIPVWKKSLSSVYSLEAGQLPSRGVLFKTPQELEITGPHAATGPVTGYGAATCSLWGILPTFHISPRGLELGGPLEKRLAVKLFVSDVDVKQSVASWLQTINFNFFLLRDTILCATVGHVLQVKYQRWLHGSLTGQ